MSARWLALLVLLAPSAALALPEATTEVDVVHDGHERFFLVHLPPQAAAGQPLPVILNFHGGGGDPVSHERWTGMDAVADREGFIAVYPAGYGRGHARTLLTWNAGGCCGPASDDDADDVGFVRRVIEELRRRAPVDPSRIYATGMSNGAMMTYRLARELGSQIAAIAPVSGANAGPPPAAAPPMPVMHVHSVDDPRALYGGGLGPPFPFTDRRVQHPPVEEVVAAWAKHDGCTGSPVPAAPRTSGAGHTATRLAWTGCAAPVVLWRLTGSGHVWPGGAGRRELKLLGAPTDVIDANQEIWAFVRQFHRDGAPALPPVTGAIEAPVRAPTPEGSRELPFSRSALAVEATGDRLGSDAPDTRAGTLALRASTTLLGRAHLGAGGFGASALVLGISGRAFTTDVPAVADDRRFYRVGASLSAFRLAPSGNLYSLHLGTFVAEQGRLLDSPQLHVFGFGLGTTRVGQSSALVYGLGYTYSFGRGLPLAFLGIDWPWAARWRLQVLLPLLARVWWQTTEGLAFTFGSAVSGDLYRYQAAPADEIRQLHIARLRLGAGGHYRLARGVTLLLELGAEGASIDDGVSSHTARGGYLRTALSFGRSPRANDGAALGD